MKLLDVGDRIWVKVPGRGFVGVGRVKGRRVPFSEFVIETPDGERPASYVLTDATYHRAFAGDPEKSEYFVPVEWRQTVPLDRAVQEVGMFGNQNTACKPKTPCWRTTVDRLKVRSLILIRAPDAARTRSKRVSHSRLAAIFSAVSCPAAMSHQVRWAGERPRP